METLDDTTYADIRGFNYQPSHASHGIEIWGSEFNPQLVRKELWIGKHHYPDINTVRIWLSHDAYTRYPERFADRLGAVLDMGDDYGVEFVVTLFNGWHSYPDLGGLHPFSLGNWLDRGNYDEVFEPYVAATVGEHADHDNVLMWDLCNEPSLSRASVGEGIDDFEVDRSMVVYRFLERVYEQIQGYDPDAPTTVGTIPSVTALELFEPLAEVLSTHPYYTWNTDGATSTEEGFAAFLDDAVEYANEAGKPLVGNETGWGALDDEKRAEVLEVELGGQAERAVGFTAHLLHHTYVADGHRPGHGPVSEPGYMAFVEPDGSRRAHHGVFNEF